MSSPVFEMLRHEGLTVSLDSPIMRQILQYLGFAFVDDTDKIAAAPTLQEAVSHMQALLDAWADGHHITGGSLVPEKSFWYLVEVKSLPTGSFDFQIYKDNDLNLYLPDGQGHCIPLQRHSPFQAQKTLGVYFTPSGNMTLQKTKLQEIAKQWAASIWASSLSRHLVWQSFHMGLLKKLEYVLPTTTLSRADCDEIIRPTLWACLQCSGFLGSFPHAVVYGPFCLQGLAVPNLYDTQGICHVMKLLKYSDQPTSTNYSLLHCCLENQQLESGLPVDPLTLPARSLSYLTPLG